jgi:hypothetical protein
VLTRVKIVACEWCGHHEIDIPDEDDLQRATQKDGAGRYSHQSGKWRNQKSEMIRFLCTQEERAQIEARATAAGLTMSEYLRRSALGENLTERLLLDQARESLQAALSRLEPSTPSTTRST